MHDFVLPGATGGKAIPYGVYDLNLNEGCVSVGIDHDTPTFAARSIRRWWQQGDGDQGAGLQIGGVLGFVGQMRCAHLSSW